VKILFDLLFLFIRFFIPFSPAYHLKPIVST